MRRRALERAPGRAYVLWGGRVDNHFGACMAGLALVGAGLHVYAAPDLSSQLQHGVGAVVERQFVVFSCLHADHPAVAAARVSGKLRLLRVLHHEALCGWVTDVRYQHRWHLGSPKERLFGELPALHRHTDVGHLDDGCDQGLRIHLHGVAKPRHRCPVDQYADLDHPCQHVVQSLHSRRRNTRRRRHVDSQHSPERHDQPGVDDHFRAGYCERRLMLRSGRRRRQRHVDM